MCKLGNLCAPDAHPSAKFARMLRLPVLRAVLGCICCLVGSGALVASIPFFLEVSPFLHVATELDAAESFERLNSSCRVLSIRRCWSSTPDALEPSVPQSERDPAGQPHCWLSYRARFTPGASNRDTRIYLDWPEYVLNGTGYCPQNSGSGCSDKDYRVTPSGRFRSGKSTSCWQPKRSSVDKRFRCGNPPCCAHTHRGPKPCV